MITSPVYAWTCYGFICRQGGKSHFLAMLLQHLSHYCKILWQNKYALTSAPVNAHPASAVAILVNRKVTPIVHDHTFHLVYLQCTANVSRTNSQHVDKTGIVDMLCNEFLCSFKASFVWRPVGSTFTSMHFIRTRWCAQCLRDIVTTHVTSLR